MAKNPQTPAPAASFLSTLVVSNEKRSVAPNAPDPTVRARENALRGVAEQLKHLEAALAGTEYRPTRVKYEDGADGKRVKVDAPKRASLWYWKSGDVWFTECRYDRAPISFGEAGSALRCGSKLEDVVTTLRTVGEAITAGELDKELAALVSKRNRAGRASKG